MAEAPVNELAIPEGVHTADNAIEVLRAWIVDGTLHVTFDPGVFGQDVGEWGRLLGDIACHAAAAVALNGQADETDALDAIRQGIDIGLEQAKGRRSGTLRGPRRH